MQTVVRLPLLIISGAQDVEGGDTSAMSHVTESEDDGDLGRDGGGEGN